MGTAIYGGTFDPFHKAHRRLIKAVLKTGIIDRLYVMPAGAPPHKGRREVSFSAYRYQMTKLALDKPKYRSVKVSDYEIKQQGPSYTIATVRYFREHVLEPGETLYLVIGSDSLMELETWREYEELLKSVTFLVARRPGTDSDDALLARKDDLEERFGAKIHFFHMKPSDTSSTAIREAIAAGDTELKQVPLAVRQFIRRNKLYQDDPLDIFSEEQILELRAYERRLMHMMSSYRLVHSLNVMYEAVRLARRFSVDPWKAAVAGLLHDMAKEKDYRRYPELLAKMDPSFLNNKPIIHGPVGSYLVKEQFGIDDPAIRDAIYHHSSLSPVPAPLEKVVYLADKIEPGRDFADLEPIRRMAEIDLDRAILLTIEGSSAGIMARGGKIHKDTLAARNYLQRRVQEREKRKTP